MLLPFFQWCETLWLGQFVVGSNWLFPVIEAVHLLFLSLLGGAMLIVDLRLLGLGLKAQRVGLGARGAPVHDRRAHRHGRDRRPAVPLGSRSSAITALRSG